MAHCPYCGAEVEAGASRCELCGEIPSVVDQASLNDTTPFVPTYDAMAELRRTSKFEPAGERRASDPEQPIVPLPKPHPRTQDHSVERAVQIEGAAASEPAEQLRNTMVEHLPAKVAAMPETIVGVPSEGPPGGVAGPADPKLKDTLLNVQAISERPGSGEQARLDSITFSELDAENLGAAPLESNHFRQPERDPTTSAPRHLTQRDNEALAGEGPGSDEVAQGSEIPQGRAVPQVSAVPQGSEVPLGSVPRPALPDAKLTGELIVQARSGGLAWLCHLLCLCTGLLWIGVAALAAAPFLALPQLGQLLAWSPIHAEYLPVIPGVLTLLCIGLAASVSARIDQITRKASWSGALIKLLLIFVLTTLPWIGAIPGLIFGWSRLFRRRPAGGLLLLYTLGWHAAVTLYIWAHLLSQARQQLPVG